MDRDNFLWILYIQRSSTVVADIKNALQVQNIINKIAVTITSQSAITHPDPIQASIMHR